MSLVSDTRSIIKEQVNRELRKVIPFLESQFDLEERITSLENKIEQVEAHLLKMASGIITTDKIQTDVTSLSTNYKKLKSKTNNQLNLISENFKNFIHQNQTDFETLHKAVIEVTEHIPILVEEAVSSVSFTSDPTNNFEKVVFDKLKTIQQVF